MLILLLIVLLSCLLYGFFIEPERLRREELQIDVPGLPEIWNQRKILLFSDLHLGPGMRPGRLKKFMGILREEAADLVLFAGDFTEEIALPASPGKEKIWRDTLSSLQPALGFYGVYGNHDRSCPESFAACGKTGGGAGILFLKNKGLMLDGLYLMGLDDGMEGHPSCQEALENKTDGQAFEICLFHEPDLAATLPEAESQRLLLSGHSHNGQIRPFGLYLYREKCARHYVKGLYQISEKTKLYVSSGLGTVGIHARFMAPPSYTVIQLRSRSV